MFRTSVTALTLTLLTVAAPLYAADRDASGTIDESVRTVVAASNATAVATDWTMAPVSFGAPSRGRLLPALYVSLAGLNAVDAYTTSKGLSRGASESNAVMKGVAGNQAALWAVKGGVTASSIFIAERLWRGGHKPQAVAVMIISNGMMAAVSARNASVLRNQR
jgi:hypothetical protein